MKHAANTLAALFVLAAVGCAPGPDGSPGAAAPANAVQKPANIPPRTVVLTFDDGVRTHLDLVAPLLVEHGFGATFFITSKWMADREHYLDFAEVAELARMGFEIGNHTWEHSYHHAAEQAIALPGALRLLEEGLASAGVPRPVSFAWPGNTFGPESLRALSGAGYQFARRGCEPEHSGGGLAMGPVYDPRVNHRLLIPSSIATPEWTASHFRQVVDRAVAGKAVVLQFHGIPDPGSTHLSVEPDAFRAFVAVLAGGGFNVIALRDLARYGADGIPSRDPMTKVRYPRRG